MFQRWRGKLPTLAEAERELLPERSRRRQSPADMKRILRELTVVMGGTIRKAESDG